jgi:hypothetical protein
MIQLFFYFFELLSFRRSPADAPYSPRLLVALIGFDITFQAIVNHGFGTPGSTAVAIATDVFFIAGLAGILALRNTLARLIQTLIAYFGASFLLGLLSLGLALAYRSANAPKTGPIAVFFALGMLIVLIWHTALLTYLLRSAANWLTVQALPAALALTIVMLAGVQWLAPSA